MDLTDDSVVEELLNSSTKELSTLLDARDKIYKEITD